MAATTTGDASASSAPQELRDNDYFFAPSVPAKRTGLPRWLLAHCNFRDLAALFKCSIAIWICTLLIVIDPTLSAIGQATFFSPIALLILPPSGALLPGLLGGATIVVGCCVGWAWGTITMKAALATRPAADLQRRLAQLQQAASAQTTNVGQASGQTQFAQIAIFDGFMLDARVSVTPTALWYCWKFVNTMRQARLRIWKPKLALVSIFAIIISDIYLTIAPLIPAFIGTIPEVLLKPTGIAIGVGAACNVLLFPRSASGLVLDELLGIVDVIGDFLTAFELSLRHPDACFLRDQLRQSQTKLVQHYKRAEAQMGFLKLDATFGKLCPEDVQSMWRLLLPVMFATSSMMAGSIAHADRRGLSDGFREFLKEPANPKSEVREDDTASQSGGHNQTHHSGAGEKVQAMSQQMTSTKLTESNLELTAACKGAINALRSFLRAQTGQGGASVDGAEGLLPTKHVLDRLRESLANTAVMTAEPPAENGKDNPSEHGTQFASIVPWLERSMHDMVVQARMRALAKALEPWLTSVLPLEQSRKRRKLWLPGQRPSRKKSVEKANGAPSEDSHGSDLRGGNPAQDEKREHVQAIFDQLTMTQATGGRKRSTAGLLLTRFISWLTGTEGAFALRTLVCTVAFGVIAVLPNSAGFFYKEKGLWGLIMSQTGLAVYSGDFVYAVLARVTGTVFGGVVGMAAWYIGAAGGPGNPYGIAAITAPIILVLVSLRLFLPAEYSQAVIMAGATFFLVVGYSWSDTHVPSYGNPGVGYAVFWRRTLLVLTGFGVAALVTVLPRPPSANRHYRRVISDQLIKIENIYALFVLQSKRVVTGANEAVEKTAIAIAITLMEAQAKIPTTKLEYSQSNIDTETLQSLTERALDLNRSLATFVLYNSRMRQGIKERVTHCYWGCGRALGL
ncbi:hypothetical protein LTR56_026662 [Elasticomyces elasticus]|nr:hypothetical protein LTR56_026662 [Elasticomyces elasticus]KAK4899596.1 hypothetical protein LTR49_027616 [Elasticomyces elasticus]KAK5734479.1 hypothetical protein LTS12_026691 [Elasticomyces elasticus]